MIRHNTETCANCGLTIEYRGNWTSAWVHITTGSIWCDAGGHVRATPR